MFVALFADHHGEVALALRPQPLTSASVRDRCGDRGAVRDERIEVVRDERARRAGAGDADRERRGESGDGGDAADRREKSGVSTRVTLLVCE